jgi:hypothetical protein
MTNRCVRFQNFIANQIEIATMAATIAAHAIGATRFELPLRGESLAAWLNSRFTGNPGS